jgi:cell division protein ZapA
MRTYEVKILGQRYKIRSDEGQDYIEKLAEYVNDQISEVQRGSKSVATHSVAILAAMNIADNLFKIRDGDSVLKKEVRERVRKILRLIRAGKEGGEPAS